MANVLSAEDVIEIRAKRIEAKNIYMEYRLDDLYDFFATLPREVDKIRKMTNEEFIEKKSSGEISGLWKQFETNPFLGFSLKDALCDYWETVIECGSSYYSEIYSKRSEITQFKNFVQENKSEREFESILVAEPLASVEFVVTDSGSIKLNVKKYRYWKNLFEACNVAK